VERSLARTAPRSVVVVYLTPPRAPGSQRLGRRSQVEHLRVRESGGCAQGLVRTSPEPPVAGDTRPAIHAAPATRQPAALGDAGHAGPRRRAADGDHCALNRRIMSAPRCPPLDAVTLRSLLVCAATLGLAGCTRGCDFGPPARPCERTDECDAPDLCHRGYCSSPGYVEFDRRCRAEPASISHPILPANTRHRAARIAFMLHTSPPCSIEHTRALASRSGAHRATRGTSRPTSLAWSVYCTTPALPDDRSVPVPNSDPRRGHKK
jgi:hypothetical protein